MHADDVSFHNVAERRPVPGRDGVLLQRVPEDVRVELNDAAQGRVRHPAGVELRFVPSGPVEVTLSSSRPEDREASAVEVFWGPFREPIVHEIGRDPTTIRVSPPERLADLDPSVAEAQRIHPRVCRLVLPGGHRGGTVCYQGAAGERRPPKPDELPDRRFFAYGTSITEGESASVEHLTYVSRAATVSETDAINLGSCGSAYCERAMADYVADRDDWDVATLSISVNMLDTFSFETFRERARYMVETVASANPDRPVLCITLFPNDADLCAGGGSDCERFREGLRTIVADAPGENVHLLDGPELLSKPGGLTTDLLHPGDDGMIQIGHALGEELDRLLV